MGKRIKNNLKFILFIACLLLTGMGFFLGAYFNENPLSVLTKAGNTKAQQEFDLYLDQLFLGEITANTINLHYTIKTPENYGITGHTATYGTISEEGHNAGMSGLENIQAVLMEFNPKQLKLEQQLTYDILKEETAVARKASNLYLYQELLSPSNGIQAELPVLLAEYTFYREKDVKDYLMLLTKTPEYFKQILLFEMEKANNGLFMSEFAAEDVIRQCKSFIADKENNYLVDTFQEKINAVDGLNEEKKKEYIKQNKEAVLNAFIPAYEMLIAGMNKMKAAGQNQQGLKYLPKGKAYYEYLVEAYTGSDMTVKEMQQAIVHQRAQDMSEAAKLLAQEPKLLSQTAIYTFKDQEPKDVLMELQEKMKPDFPIPPDTGFEVKYVHSSMEEYMAPAFYLTIPIDDISRNAIYINQSNNYRKLKLYITLAHEGYPGHMYQNLMERSRDFAPIRNILGTGGYSEGWATYVEMISYSYADMDPKLAELFQKDQSALLSLYASADLGIHYDGWNLEEMMEFFGKYQIKDKEVLTDIYHLIVEEPAHYLKYYIGYLEFLNLKEYAKDLYGEQYSDYRFHEALMKMGPAQFSLLRKYLPKYYE